MQEVWNPYDKFSTPSTNRLLQASQAKQNIINQSTQDFTQKQEPKENAQEFINPIEQGVINFDSKATAETLNDQNISDSLFALHNMPEGKPPQAEQEAPQETNKTIYTLGARNTGIAYFDNKKDLSLLDAYIAKQLGLKTARLEHKIDLKSDNRHRHDSLSKTADELRANAYYADTFMQVLATNLANDKSSLSGAVSQKVRELLRGVYGGEATEKSAINAFINASAMKSAGGSRQLSKERVEMAEKEYYQAQNLDQKAQVIKYHLASTRNALVANANRARASGSMEQLQNNLEKIREIDAFIAKIDQKDYNGIAQFMLRKNSFAPIPSDYSDSDSEIPTQRY